MSTLGFIWMEDTSYVGVYPPSLEDPVWRLWLDRQDARKRKFIKEPLPGYWLISADLLPKVQERFIEIGWGVYFSKPPFLTGFRFVEKEQNVKDPFLEFYLLPTAPKEIVDAVYRQLMKTYHTDTGGNKEKATFYNGIKEQIYELKGW